MKLCGGTLLTLLCAVKRTPINKVNFLGLRGSCSEAMMLAGLLKMICPEYREDLSAAFKTTASRYKNCQCNAGRDLPLNRSSFTSQFHRRVSERTREVLQEMELYCRTFLMVEKKDRMEWLAKSILDLIASDPLAREKLRMISPDGIPVRGEALPEMETICLPSLLTGCLDYIVECVPYNTEGQETIENWLCAENEKYTGKVRCPFSVETEIPKSDPDCPAGKEPAETGGQGETNSGEVRQENRPAADEPGREEMSEPVGPQARENARNFNGINIFSGAHVGQIQYVQMPAAGGGSMMELLSLDTGLYHLFVTEGSLFQGNTFSVAKTVSLNRHIRQDIKEHFLELRPAEQAELIRFPAVFASVNRGDRETEAVHMAMLGRITAIHVQSSVISFEWKAFCPFPQQILNRNESLFSIWHAPAANELEEEHWTMKPVPLIRSLQTAGFDPYRSMSAGQAWN